MPKTTSFILTLLLWALLLIGFSAASPAVLDKPTQETQRLPPGSSAEKLKRGLTNFINQLNPAPFFVPAMAVSSGGGGNNSSGGGGGINPKQQQPKQSSQQSLAEPAAIVNTDQSGDQSMLMKAPKRVGHSRPIGGPLRFGRRR